MKKTLFMMGCLVLFLTASTITNAQIFSPVAHMEGTIDIETMAFFIGQISFSGSFKGYKIDDLPDNPLFDDINAYPLFGNSIFEDIENVTIFDINITNIGSFEDILNLTMTNVSHFSNVNIFANKGPFLLGTDHGNINIYSSLDYAISSVISLDLYMGNKIPFFTIITRSHIDTQFSGESALLVQTSSNGDIIIVDDTGNKLWNGDSANKIFFIEDVNLSFIQDPPLYMFPLIENNEDIEVFVSPSESTDIDIYSLFEDVTYATAGLVDIPDVSNMIQGLDEIISTVSTIVNGGMFLLETDDSFTIDDSTQIFSNIGFARGNKFKVTISPKTQVTKIDGDYKLIFLGGHLYSSQAKDSENGLAFPLPILIVWVIAAILFLLFRYYLKIDANKELDEKIKKYLLIFHIVVLIVAFTLLDREISYQFGSSAIDALMGQGFSLVLAAFIIVEFVMWGLGYLLLAFPIHMITMSGLKYFRIGKDGKHLSKGMGALFIWVFCAFYVKLIVNLIFLIINPNNFFPMG